jgi:hypothetical protein
LSVCEPAATRLVAQNTEAAVTCEACETGFGSHKVIARVTVQGIWLWCRGCRHELLLAWAELDRLRLELRH